MADFRHFFNGTWRESRGILGFLKSPSAAAKKSPESRHAAAASVPNGLAQSGDTACEPGEFPGRCVLVEDAFRDAAGELGLDPPDRFESLFLVARLDRGFDLLDEGADTADAGAVDLGAACVASDSFLCL